MTIASFVSFLFMVLQIYCPISVDFKFPNNPSLEPIDTSRFFSVCKNPKKINEDAQIYRLKFTGFNDTVYSRSPSINPTSSAIDWKKAYKSTLTRNSNNLFVHQLNWNFNENPDKDERKNIEEDNTELTKIYSTEDEEKLWPEYGKNYPQIKKFVNVCSVQ